MTVIYIYADKWDQLHYPFTGKAINGEIVNIHDGRAYQKLSKPGGFLTVQEHTGLVLYADGVQLIKLSSK